VQRDYFKIEKNSGDFPYYAGDPQKLTIVQWLSLVLVLLAQFWIMSTATLSFLPKGIATALMDIFLVGVPMGLLWWFTKHAIGALFKPLKWRDTLTIIKYVLLMVVIGLGSTIALNLIGQTTNGDVAGDQVTGLVGYLAVFLDNILSLFWEELISLIPLLAMMAGLKALGVSRKISIILSTIVTSILFGALHLPSYQWNVPMVFTSIVFLRLILDVLYLKTKNIWLTYVTHLLYDSFVFALPLIFGLIFKH